VILEHSLRAERFEFDPRADRQLIGNVLHGGCRPEMHVQLLAFHGLEYDVGPDATSSRCVLTGCRFDTDHLSFQRDHLGLIGLPSHTRCVTRPALSVSSGRNNTPQQCHNRDKR
jgi:hypothetical protein